jgi:hypothetical protein
VEGSCEHDNEPWDSIKCWEILEWLCNWRFLKKLCGVIFIKYKTAVVLENFHCCVIRYLQYLAMYISFTYTYVNFVYQNMLLPLVIFWIYEYECLTLLFILPMELHGRESFLGSR